MSLTWTKLIVLAVEFVVAFLLRDRLVQLGDLCVWLQWYYNCPGLCIQKVNIDINSDEITYSLSFTSRSPIYSLQAAYVTLLFVFLFFSAFALPTLFSATERIKEKERLWEEEKNKLYNCAAVHHTWYIICEMNICIL